MPSTLRDYRRRFARHVGLGLVAGAATGGTLAYLEDTLRTTSLPIGDDRTEWWLLRPDAVNVRDRLRLVHHLELEKGHLHADFPPGDGYTVAPTAGEVYEVISPEFHPLDEIHDFINQALRFIRIPGEVGLPTAVGLTRTPVSTVHPWLIDASHVWQAGLLDAAVTRERGDPYTWPLYGHLEYGGGSLSLSHPTHYFVGGPTAPLLADVTAVATTVTVGTPTGGPLPVPPYTLTLERELLLVTAQVGATLSVTRGTFGTTPAAHAMATVVAAASPVLFLRGLFPASAFCTNAAGVRQTGLQLDTDVALPDEQWVTAGALKEAWLSAPQTVESLTAQTHGLNLQQATLAFQRWQETSLRRSGLRRTLRDAPQPARATSDGWGGIW